MENEKMTITDEAYDILDKKNKISELEQFRADSYINNLPEIIEQKKDQIVDQIIEFQDKHIQVKYDKYGNETKIINPYLISTYFFKTINPINTKVPKYNADKLSFVWDLYMYLIEQVNLNIGAFNPSLTHFCKFAGICLETFNNYKASGDQDLMILCGKISDEILSGNFEMAQNKMLSEKTTLTRLKVENQITEQPKVNINVDVSSKVDRNFIESRLTSYQKLLNKMPTQGEKE